MKHEDKKKALVDLANANLGGSRSVSSTKVVWLLQSIEKSLTQQDNKSLEFDGLNKLLDGDKS